MSAAVDLEALESLALEFLASSRSLSSDADAAISYERAIHERAVREAVAALVAVSSDRGRMSPLVRAFPALWPPMPAPESLTPETIYLPDPDTHLGSDGGSDEREVLSLTKDTDPGYLAAWDFERGLRRGTAHDAEGRYAERGEAGESGWRLRLSRFGEAEAELAFDVEDPLRENPVLVLRHLAARREYLLHGGVAHVLIELDGELLAEFHELDSLPIEQSVVVYRALLPPGPHRFVIRSGPRSTTTYWLMGASLRYP